MHRPCFKLIGLTTWASFTLLTLFGHALHEAHGHAAHFAACDHHACHAEDGDTFPVLGHADADHSAAHGECRACDYFHTAQQPSADVLCDGDEPLLDALPAKAGLLASGVVLAGYHPRGPPVSAAV